MLPKNGIAAAVVADATAPIVSIEVFRDIHWLRPPLDVGAPPGARRSDARHVPDGFVYLLGDNSVDSRDSRMFGPVSIASFVGRPTWVLGPWPYTRKLAR
jgi:type IV secretory pathway protease TraF